MVFLLLYAKDPDNPLEFSFFILATIYHIPEWI